MGGGHGSECGAGHGGGHGEGHGAGHSIGHATGHGHVVGEGGVARHDQRINSFSIVREGEIDSKRMSLFFRWVGMLPQEFGTIYRIKCVLAVRGYPFKHVFHSVMDVSDEDDAGPWAEGEKKICKAVFIGKSLHQKKIREAFEELFAHEAKSMMARSQNS